MIDLYQDYLANVRQLRSASKYAGAMRTVNRFLHENPTITGGLPIESLGDLHKMEEATKAVMALPDFAELDGRGNRMYSTALKHFLAYAGGHPDIIKAHSANPADRAQVPAPEQASTTAYPAAPVPPKAPVTYEGTRYQRNPRVTEVALEAAGYKCFRDPSHTTFPVDNSEYQYMEGHHFIPLKAQSHFPVSLDIVQNIVCLCPTCHRLLHYASMKLREDTFDEIFEIQGARLALAGIEGSRKKLRDLALS